MNNVTVERVGELYVLSQVNHGKDDNIYLTEEQAKILVPDLLTAVYAK